MYMLTKNTSWTTDQQNPPGQLQHQQQHSLLHSTLSPKRKRYPLVVERQSHSERSSVPTDT